MYIWREYKADRINEIVNHPSVHPWVSTNDEALDLSAIIADRRNTLLMGEHGGVFFILSYDGVYEAHTQVLPEGRGQWAAEFVESCLAWMFTRTASIEIYTRVPDGNRPARALAVAVGGIKEFHRADGWARNGEKIGCDIYSIQIKDWIRTASGLEERGIRLHEEFQAEGILSEDHGDCESHNRYAGLAMMMIEGHQPQKAQWWYNAWAVKAGFDPIVIQSMTPLVFAIGSIVIEYDGRMRVVACQ